MRRATYGSVVRQHLRENEIREARALARPPLRILPPRPLVTDFDPGPHTEPEPERVIVRTETDDRRIRNMHWIDCAVRIFPLGLGLGIFLGAAGPELFR